MDNDLIKREKELKYLESIYSNDKFELMIISGRRRVGKTELIKEFCDTRGRPLFVSLLRIHS